MLFQFEVKGSQGDIYRIRAGSKEGNPWISCNCQAGQNATVCKHRVALLNGDVTNLASANSADVEGLKALFAGSSVLRLMASAAVCESRLAAAKSELANVRKQLGRAMVG